MSVQNAHLKSETRDRLLAAAWEVFPEHGYQGTTTAQICKQAEANGAAVNYYFGSKQGLYVAMWQQHFGDAAAHIAALMPQAEGRPPEERLRLRIRTFLGNVLDGGPLGRLWLHELVRPTGLIDDLRRQALANARQGMRAVLRVLLGEEASEHEVTLCQMSVANQCLALGMKPLYLEDLKREGGDRLDPDELADHITRFSLAGIREVRRQSAARES